MCCIVQFKNQCTCCSKLNVHIGVVSKLPTLTSIDTHTHTCACKHTHTTTHTHTCMYVHTYARTHAFVIQSSYIAAFFKAVHVLKLVGLSVIQVDIR